MKTETSQFDKGYVYILGNKLFPSLLKIGRTSRTPQIRCNELSQSTAIPEPFQLIDYIKTPNPCLLEYLTHAYLMCENKRYNPSKEFFQTTLVEARTIIKSLNLYINRHTAMTSQNPVGFASFDIPEETYYFDVANAVDPFLYCAKFNFSAEMPEGLNPYTWEILLQKINLIKK